MYDYLDLRQTERLKELVPYKALAPDADEIIEELDRLNNIINELEKWIKAYLYMLNGIQDRDIYEQCQLDDFTDIMEKLQELKENNNNG